MLLINLKRKKILFVCRCALDINRAVTANCLSRANELVYILTQPKNELEYA